MMHRHSCKACCINGPTIYVAAGEPPGEEEAPSFGGNHHVTSSALNLSHVAASATANPHRHLIHPCGCMHSTLHENLYLQPHNHNMQTYLHSESCALSGAHTDQAPEPLHMEVPACTHTHVHNHAHTIQHSHAHAHHHQRPLAMPKSLALVRKFGSDVYGSQPLALNNPNVIDAQPLAMCRSMAPMCDKLLVTSTTNKVHAAAAPCCAAHMCVKPALSRTQTGSDVCHHQTQAVDRCQIHPQCVAPVINTAAYKALQMPEGCRVLPPLQPPPKAPKAEVAVPAYNHNAIYNNKVLKDHCKEVPHAGTGGQNEDDFWKGATYDKMQGGGDVDTSKGGRGSYGNGWRGGRNSRGRGSNHQASWNCSKDDNGGNDDAWKGTEPGTGNGRSGGRGRGCGRGGWQPNKRKREVDGADWEGFKPSVCGERSNVEGSGWGNPNNGNGWGNQT